MYLLYDQIYSQLTFGEYKHYDPVTLRPELRDYTIFVDGGSKCFAATGVRVGWCFGPAAIINNMKAIVGHLGAWWPKAEQVAMAEYLKNEPVVDTFLDKLKADIKASLNTLHEGFYALKAEGFSIDSIEPMGAIYLTVKVCKESAATKQSSTSRSDRLSRSACRWLPRFAYNNLVG